MLLTITKQLSIEILDISSNIGYKIKWGLVSEINSLILLTCHSLTDILIW